VDRGGPIRTGTVFVDAPRARDVLESDSLDRPRDFVRIQQVVAGFLPETLSSRRGATIHAGRRGWMSSDIRPLASRCSSSRSSVVMGRRAEPSTADRSNPPWVHAGISTKTRRLRSRDYLFISRARRTGALFEVAMAREQGDGARSTRRPSKTSARGRLSAIVRRALHARWPRAEKPPTTSARRRRGPHEGDPRCLSGDG